MAKWSYSSITLFQQCPKKYYHLRVAKDIVEPPSEQMRYGLMVHEAAEKYVRDGVPLPPAFTYVQDALDRLMQDRKDGGRVFCEHKMGLTEQLEPCDFFAPEVWWRGIADFLAVRGNTARVVDYKTGKSQYADTKQLELLALATFAHFPEVEVVKAGLLFVVHPALVKAKYLQAEKDERWPKWKEIVAQLDAAEQNSVWNPKQNFTCRAWCPVVTCSHNGKNR